MVVMTVRKKAVSDGGGLNLEPGHLLHACAAAIQQYSRRADIDEDS